MGRIALSPALTDELTDRFDAEVARAVRAPGRQLASATVAVEGGLDPSAVAFAVKRPDDRWFCWEQPHSGGFALAAVGSVAEVVRSGADRFDRAAEAVAALFDGHGKPDLPPAAGPVLVGGFGFWPEGPTSDHWSSFPAALLVLPELSLSRSAGGTHVTLNALVEDERDAADARRRARERVATLADTRALPLLDPPHGCRIASVRPPAAFEAAVTEACGRMRGSQLRKVVLAREVVVEAPRAHDPAAVFGAIREGYDTCFCFCVGGPEAAFVGASPELLVRRRGASLWTVALAASSRRSIDASVDRRLAEQLASDPKARVEHDIVVDRIVAKLWRHCVQVDHTAPEVVKVLNIQHLATPIRGLLRDAASAVELAGVLHPTPALGGEPWDLAAPAMRELEQLDRGWYGAPIGWVDSVQDGEFCVGIRSALLRDRTARVFAGNGIVEASDPRAELAETEVKLQVLLPLLAG